MGMVNNILKKLADITYPWPVGMVYPTSTYYATNNGGDINLQKATGKSILRRYMSSAAWSGSGATSNVWTPNTAAATCTLAIVREPQYIYLRGVYLTVSNAALGTAINVGTFGTGVFPSYAYISNTYSTGFSDGGGCIFGVRVSSSSSGSTLYVTPMVKKDKTTTNVSFSDGMFSLFVYPDLDQLNSSSHPISFEHIAKTGIS